MSKYVICLVGVSGLNVAGSRRSCPARLSMRHVELSRSGGHCCCGWGKRYGPILTSCDMGLSPILALNSPTYISIVLGLDVAACSLSLFQNACFLVTSVCGSVTMLGA